MARISKLNIKDSQDGIVSFLAVLFITILLTIIVTGLVRVMINEQRVATDFDQSAKAYYAAEAGVEDAIADIQEAMSANDGDPSSAVNTSCDASDRQNVISGGSDDIQYTCQLINISPVLKEGLIKRNNSAQINLDTVPDAFESIALEWHLKGEDFNDTFGVPNVRFGNPETQPTDNWNDASAPGYLKVNVVEYPRGSFSRGDIKSHVFFLLPNAVNGDTPTSRSLNVIGGTENDKTAPRVQTNCNLDTQDYACSAIIEDLQSSAGNSRYIVIVKSFYNDAHYKFEALNSSGNPVEISGNEVVIDVTGRAGDVFRRVVAKIPLRSNTFGQDYVLLTDETLCKSFDITREDPPEADTRGAPQEDGCVPF